MIFMEMDIQKLLKNKGVVGAGGGGFPTYAKLKKEGIKFYIANGAECEPLLWVSKEIMGRFPYEVLKGLEYLKEYTGASRGIIALKSKYYNLLNILGKTISKKNLSVEIFELEDYYPAGDEHVLVYEITRKVIPAGGIPLAVGAIVNNVETLLNVYYAIEQQKPVIYKYITISGDISNPVTVKVPVGAKISWILERLKINYKEMVVIDGGPAMGKIVEPDSPITKTTGGILLFHAGHPAVIKKTMEINKIIKQARISCIQCRYCTDQCPRYLLGHSIEPHKIMAAVGYRLSNRDLYGALICSECGVCEIFSCPEGLSPRRVNQELKRELGNKGIKYKPEKKKFLPREAREWRRIPTARLKNKMGLNASEDTVRFDDTLLLPEEVYIPTKQHVGISALPVVKQGERVEEGQVIAEVGKNSLGCNIHASISGIVTGVSDDLLIIQREE
jgi:Na+-translocating ferredoxin:NAD+ oxidoreductase RnfC subunit